MKEKLLKYGIKNGKEYHISEVASGLECQCHCPSCGEDLVAKKGKNEKPQEHFAHRSKIDCEYTYETSLHCDAKRLIEKRKMIYLPYRNSYFDSVNLNGFYSLTSDYKKLGVTENRQYAVRNVVLEKKLHNFIPDIKCDISGKTLLIEIAVTSKIKEEKLNKIKEVGLPVLEIDISGMDRDFDEKDLEMNVIYNTHNKSWYENDKDDETIEILRYKHQQILEEINKFIDPLMIKQYGGSKIIENCPFILVNSKINSKKQLYECKQCDCHLATYEFNILCGFKNYSVIKSIIERINKTCP